LRWPPAETGETTQMATVIAGGSRMFTANIGSGSISILERGRIR
jgi:hypothetical protein